MDRACSNNIDECPRLSSPLFLLFGVLLCYHFSPPLSNDSPSILFLLLVYAIYSLFIVFATSLLFFVIDLILSRNESHVIIDSRLHILMLLSFQARCLPSIHILRDLRSRPHATFPSRRKSQFSLTIPLHACNQSPFSIHAIFSFNTYAHSAAVCCRCHCYPFPLQYQYDVLLVWPP
jgi:hypothetical protein